MTSPALPGEVYLAVFGDPVGHEQGGFRPAVVVSRAEFQALPSGLVVVVPVTSRDRGLPHQVALDFRAAGLDRPSWVRTEELRSISAVRLRKRVGRVTFNELALIKKTIRQLTGL